MVGEIELINYSMYFKMFINSHDLCNFVDILTKRTLTLKEFKFNPTPSQCFLAYSQDVPRSAATRAPLCNTL